MRKESNHRLCKAKLTMSIKQVEAPFRAMGVPKKVYKPVLDGWWRGKTSWSFETGSKSHTNFNRLQSIKGFLPKAKPEEVSWYIVQNLCDRYRSVISYLEVYYKEFSEKKRDRRFKNSKKNLQHLKQLWVDGIIQTIVIVTKTNYQIYYDVERGSIKIKRSDNNKKTSYKIISSGSTIMDDEINKDLELETKLILGLSDPESPRNGNHHDRYHNLPRSMRVQDENRSHPRWQDWVQWAERGELWTELFILAQILGDRYNRFDR